jgi:hypothetical protein
VIQHKEISEAIMKAYDTMADPKKLEIHWWKDIHHNL